MFSLKTKKPAEPRSRDPRAGKDKGQAKRDRENARGRAASASVRDIGPCPPPADPDRRQSCERDYPRFCKIYFPDLFYLPWSEDHLRVAKKIESVVLDGGLSAIAMPRGGGKTTLCMCGCCFALLYGHRHYVTPIGATLPAAKRILENLKKCLRTNDLLYADFPEVCRPIRALEDDARRCRGQLCEGERTDIIWKLDKIVLPTVKGSLASGSIVTAHGITSALRGMNHMLADGRIIRPDLVIPDDPQDRESAESDDQCEKRVSILSGDILGLAGPGKKIAGIMPCTVIRAGDMADRILDRKQHPDWKGERCKLVYSFPTNTALWEQYAKIRAASLESDGDGHEATEFYREHRAEMDEGAKVAWPQRFEDGEISGLQYALNLKLKDEAAFFAEYQNEPKSGRSDSVMLKPEQIVRKLNGLDRGRLPLEAQKITAMVDVHDELLYWVVCGWAMDFTGWVLDYGAFPDQGRRYFLLRDAGNGLQKMFPGVAKEAAITAGLDTLIPTLLDREFLREDGTVMHVDRLLIDTGYVPDTVYGFLRAAGRGSIAMGSRGVGITAGKKPMSEYKPQPGELVGNNWMVPKPNGRELRHVRFDANFWKTFVHDRLGLALGSRGTLTLYGRDAQDHRMLADHLTAEFPTPTEGFGRKVIEWHVRPNKPDNHLFDGVVGCAVAASTCSVGQLQQKKAKPKRRGAKVTYM